MTEVTQGAPAIGAYRWRRRRRRSRWLEPALHGVFFLCGALSVLTTVGIVLSLVLDTVGFFQEVSLLEFFTSTQWTPLFTEKHFGVLPLIAATVLIAGIAMAVAAPIGLTTAIFLSEYAPEGLRRTVKPILEVLAGIPTVVYGYFALTFVTPRLIQPLFSGAMGFNALGAGVVMGIMITPMVSSLSEDAMVAVPRSLREAAYALGGTRFEVATRVVVPAALSAVIASFILAFSRAIGETMIVTLAAGAMPNLTANPLEAMQTTTAYIVSVSLGDTPQGTLEFKTIFAVGMTLFLMTLVMNILGQWVVRRFREVY